VANLAQVIQVSVIDTGSGVPQEFHERIFEAFEQAPSDKQPSGVQGTGLGLAICKLIVEAHGGSIGLASASSTDSLAPPAAAVGSTFWFRIPK
jgi:two-component system sensor histidine kinase KdpD